MTHNLHALATTQPPCSGHHRYAAIETAKKAPEGSVLVAMLPDTGERYLSTPLFADIAADMNEEEQAQQVLERVGLPAAQISMSSYPHQLSGGQRQRVVIAMAIALRPKLLIADEPTTALDVTTQAQILRLLKKLTKEDQMGMIMITHDLAVVADMADEIAVMQLGKIVEKASPETLFTAMQHPYTKTLRCSELLKNFFSF